MAADEFLYSEGIDQRQNGPQNDLLTLPGGVFGNNFIINPGCDREGHVPSFDDPASECKALIASDSRSRYRPEFEFASRGTDRIGPVSCCLIIRMVRRVF